MQQQTCSKNHTIYKPGCRSCLKLRHTWYEKLELEGFKDIEKNEKLRTTKNSHEIRKDFQTAFQFEAKQSYYLWAKQKADQGRFKGPKDKLIWECHAEGVSQRQMRDKIGLCQPWISRKIKQIENYLKIQTDIIGSMTAFSQSSAW